MIGITQIIWVVAIAALTVMSVVIGVQVVKILQELRVSLQKLNRILDDMAGVTHSISQPLVNLSGLLENLRGGVKLVAAVKRLLGRVEPEANGEEAGDDMGYIQELQEKGRTQRFFERNGKVLG
jgi:signal transduction histidine kinase